MVDQKTPGSTYSPALGSDSPPNFEALGLDPVEQLMEEIMGPRGGEFEFYPVNQQLGLLPPNSPTQAGRTYLADTIDLDRLIRAESGPSKTPGQISSQGAYGLAQFKPSTYANWHIDSKITGVPIPQELKGKSFETVMDNEGLAKLAGKTYLRMMERYLERREGLNPSDVTVRNILGSYNVGPTRYGERLRNRNARRPDLEGVPFHLWEMWMREE